MTGGRGGRRRWPAGVLVLLVACGGGRVTLPPASPYARSPLSDYDAALRHYVAIGDTTALERIERAGPKDRLVRLLNRGLYLHRIGRHHESSDALEEADRLADERYTKSISQNIAAFLVNDRVIDYDPPAHERAMVHYYGMLNYLALGDEENALVEARRANLFLARYEQDNAGKRTYGNDALVEWLAGLLHWDAGDLNDALVSLRQADQAFDTYARSYGVRRPEAFGRDLARVARLQGADDVVAAALADYGLDSTALSAPTAPDGRPTGELVVLIEDGFVAYRRQEKVYVPLLKEDRQLLKKGDVGSVLEATARVLVHTLLWMNQASREGREAWQQYEGAVLLGATALNVDLITLAWPAYELDAHGVRAAGVAGAPRDAPVIEDLSAIAARDFEEEKPKYLARMVARALLKEAAIQSAAQAAENKGGEVLGKLTAWTARAAAVRTERADTRSWTLLPNGIRVVRLSLPAGTQRVDVTVADRAGRRTIVLDSLPIRPGRLTVRSVFVTGNYPGDQQHFKAALRGVDYVAPEVKRP